MTLELFRCPSVNDDIVVGVTEKTLCDDKRIILLLG